MDLTAALFDLDGTLINTERRSLAMWAMLLDAHDVAYDDVLLHGFMGRRGKDVLVELAHLFPGVTTEELITEVISYGDRPDLPGFAPVPGAVALVEAAAAHGSPIGVVTSAGLYWADRHLTDLGIRDLIGTLVTAQDVTVGKPDPSGYLMAARLLGVDPAAGVAFEDSPAGVAAAKAAGMTVVGVATTHAALPGADRIVADLTEVGWPI